MPTELSDLTVGEIIAWAAALSALGVGLWKIAGPLKAINDFLDHWNGKPELTDAAGRVIQTAEPGVVAAIKDIQGDLVAVKKQVQNSHHTNLRDDLDVVQGQLGELNSKFDQRLIIDKEQDAQAQETAKKLNEHIADTDRLMPMLRDLHSEWSKRGNK